MEQNQPTQTQMTPKAIAILILGICTLIFGLWGIIGVTAILGIITGIITLILSGSSGKELAANPTMYHGQGLRKTGKILGLIGFIFSIIFLIVWIILIVAGNSVDIMRFM